VNAVCPQSSLLPNAQNGRLKVADSRFIRSLPLDLQQRLAPDLEVVDLQRDDVLLRIGEVITAVYFPTTCMVSMVVTLENGSTIEATTIGSNGFVGVSTFLGKERAEATGMVQIAGEALRMEVAAFRRHLQDERFRASVGGLTAQVFATIAQSTACIAFHPVQERLARWLLMVRDGIERDEFPLTQEFLAVMLGVQRPTVTIASRTLEKAGLIEHRRGKIRIPDIEALAQAACECYRAPSPVLPVK